jgi:NAD(P)-dependent dehydrogenase (short-subunit alcohol dehydrogenase family)
VDLGLKNSIAVVTGGSSGIGLATAKYLLADGARVAICGRDAARLAAAKQKLGSPSSDALLAEPCNVLDAESVKSFAQKVAQWSGGRVDLLVNNAGQGRVSTFANTSDAQWREELDLKFFSQICRSGRFFRFWKRANSRRSSRSIPCWRCSPSRTWCARQRRVQVSRIC